MYDVCDDYNDDFIHIIMHKIKPTTTNITNSIQFNA